MSTNNTFTLKSKREIDETLKYEIYTSTMYDVTITTMDNNIRTVNVKKHSPWYPDIQVGIEDTKPDISLRYDICLNIKDKDTFKDKYDEVINFIENELLPFLDTTLYAE